MNNPLDIGETLKLGWETFTKNAVALIVGIFLAGIIGAFTFGICLGPMMIGYNQMVLRAAKGETVAVGDVFAGFQHFVPALLLYLIMIVSVFIGFMLLFLPGLILAFMFFWAPWIMAEDPTVGPIDCLKGSVEAFKRDMGGSIVFILVVGVVYGAGAVVPVFGTFVTGPIALAMAAHGVLRVAETAGSAQPAHA